MSTFNLDRIALFAVALGVFLLPVVFIPIQGLAAAPLKHTVFIVSTVLALIAWIFGRLQEGAITVPKTHLFLAAAGLPLAYLLASFFSSSFRLSFFGTGFEVDSFVTIMAAAVLFALIPLLFKNRQDLFYLILAFFGSFALLALFHIIRLLGGPDALSFGIFGTPLATPVGGWTELGIIAGFAVLLSLLTLELLPARRLFQGLLWGLMVVGIAFLALVNVFTIWLLVGLLAFVVLVYLLSFGSAEVNGASREKSRHRRISIPALVVVIATIIFLVAGGPLGNLVNRWFGTGQIEARPSWSATFTIAKEALKMNPVFGVGPGRFVELWLQHKPVGINETVFWGVDFNAGVGFVPTSLTTTGVVGFVAWLAFFAVFAWLGARALFASLKNKLAHYLIVASFLGGLYLVAFLVLYNPGVPLFILSFVCLGIFVAACVEEGIIPTKTFSLNTHSNVNFAVTLVSIVFVIIAALGGYFSIERFIASAFYGRGLVAASSGDLDRTERHIGTAAALHESDRFYRELVNVRIARLNTLLQDTGVSEDTVRSAFQNTLALGIQEGEAAIRFDAENYRNFLALGSIYEAIVPLRIEGAYERAYAMYNEALRRNPASPAIPLILARLERARGDTDAARNFIAQSLQIKPNYTEAIFFLSQIEIEEGNIDEAIASVEAASLIAPNDPTVFFRLGFLRYSEGDYRGAASALENAVKLNPVYANAKYFLGLSYYELGRTTDAVGQFKDIEVLNPDNQEVKFILANLEAGRAPLANAEPPLNEKPEERDELPIDE